MAEGIRSTHNGHRRVTEAGQRRITEHAVVLELGLTATIAGTVQLTRRRGLSVDMSNSTGMAATVPGKMALSASLSSSPAMTGALNAKQAVSAAMSTAPAMFIGMGRERSLCGHFQAAGVLQASAIRQRAVAAALAASGAAATTLNMKAAVALDLSAGTAVDVSTIRQRTVAADLTADTTVAAVPLRRVRPLTVALSASSTLSAAWVQPLYRITEDGQPRYTHAGDRRILEDAANGIEHIQPPYRIYHNVAGVWQVVRPYAKYTAAWQMPLTIHVKDGGAWRAVRSHL